MRNQSYLWDEVVSEFNVTGHCMGKTGGDQINVSLDLMDHSIRVEHVAPVLLQGLWCLPMTWSISSWILADKR